MNQHFHCGAYNGEGGKIVQAYGVILSKNGITLVLKLFLKSLYKAFSSVSYPGEYGYMNRSILWHKGKHERGPGLLLES